MARILVAGTLDLSQPDALDFARCLGEAIAEQNHILLNGCLNEFDKVIAESTFARLKEKGLDPNERIISYIVAGKEPAHKFGTVLKSRLSDWDLTFKRLYVPEQIHLADVVILNANGMSEL